ncbi:MAG: M23 family metallopeptidase [Novosphingobium sp.]|nr:M23 family metallopeptidase [Novosphingobium sp.]
MTEWRRIAKIVTTTFLVTSAAWLIGGAILFERLRHPTDGYGSAPMLSGGTSAPAAAKPALAAAVMGPANVPRLVIPVSGVRREQLADTFTQSREDGARVHNAIDIMAPLGTPVIAAAAGQVEKVFVSARGGNTIYVRSPDRTLIYYYAHLDAYAPGLVEKQAVRQGQPLGTVGFSGDASPDAPHLHFEVQQTLPQAGWWQGKISINPYPLLMRR